LLNDLTRLAGSRPVAAATLAALYSTSLNHQQVQSLRNKLGAKLGYVGRLMRRILQQGRPADDPLYAKVRAAEAVLHDLDVCLIYLAAPPGTSGRPAPPEQRDQSAAPRPLDEAAVKFKTPERYKRAVEKETPWARGATRGAIKSGEVTLRR
jgi:hypothetical protein